MRSAGLHLVVPGAILALFVGACGDVTNRPDLPDTTRAELADEVEYVAGLLEEGRGCAALEAVRVLDVMADRADDDHVRAAVGQFTAGVRDTADCDPDDPDDPDDQDDQDDQVDEDDEDKPPPGRGRGRGRGN